MGQQVQIEDMDPNYVLDQLDKADAESSLRRFIELLWKVLEPNRDFVGGWHIDAVCEHLEAITNKQLMRLLINIPPGCMKSLTTNVFWPAWEWGPRNRPDMRYVGASYSDLLTIRDNRRCRNLIRSPIYQRLWGNRFHVVDEQDAKKRFDTDYRGFKIATSVGGLGTGERGDRFIIDDPHNIKDGESEAKRLATRLWFEEVVPTRVNDPEESAILIIMQRVHEKDVSGLAIEQGYEHLRLPMEFEADHKCFTSIGFEDPRTEDGELLWKNRMTAKVVERDKGVLGEYATAAQFQQRPTPRGGGMFKREWFPIVDKAPDNPDKVVRGWDLAASVKKRAAYTAGARVSRVSHGKGYRFYIEHVLRFRGTSGQVEDKIKSTAASDGYSVKISLPQDPGQSGKAQANQLVSMLAGFTVKTSPESGDKEVRAEPVASQAEAGNIFLVRGTWNEPFLEEMSKFPNSDFKDQADATSRAFAELIPLIEELIAAGPTVVTRV